MANPVMWFEIIGPDSSALHKFYRDALGWKLTAPVKEMGNYSMVEGHEPGIGGGIGGGGGLRGGPFFRGGAPPGRPLPALSPGGAPVLRRGAISPPRTR